jgi:SAM-dependent methyltransferase
VSALERWRDLLPGWGIPEEILAAVPESPWGLPPELMRRRAEIAAESEPSVSVRRALEALPRGGSVLDVGVGGGAASLPLVPRAARIVGVDTSEDVLAAFREAADAAGVEAATISGPWPDVAPDVELADVAVCNHVLYNVADLEPFARALDDHARHRVVAEITATHPLAWMADLWTTFHGLERPGGPDAGDALEALRVLGLDVHRDDASRAPRGGGFEDRADAVALVRRRMCLSVERDAELIEALGPRLIERDGLWSAGPTEQTIVTLWWGRSS